MTHQPEFFALQGTSWQTADRYADLVRCSPMAMIVSRESDQHVELINDRFISLFGYTIEDMPDVDHRWPLAYPEPAYREMIKEAWRQRLDKARSTKSAVETLEARVRCKDGTLRDIQFHLSMLGDSFLISFVDLTDRKRAEG